MNILQAFVELVRTVMWLLVTLAVLIIRGPAAAKRRFEIPSPSAPHLNQETR